MSKTDHSSAGQSFNLHHQGSPIEEKYFHLYQNATDGLFTVDYYGYIHDANKMCERITGYSREELDKIHFSDLLAAKEKRFISHYFEMIKRKQLVPREEIQIEIVTKNSGSKIVDLHIQSATFEEGGEGIHASIRDITDKIKLKERLVHAQRMECLGKIVNEVAHKFNDILTAVLGSSSCLKDFLNKDEEVYKYADTIYKSASMGSDLVSQLMAFGSCQKFQAKLIDLHKVIKETITLIHNKNLLHKIEIISNFQETSLPVSIDKQQIMHALMNIYHNARDAMSDGGTLTFSTQEVDLSDDFCLHNLGLRHGRYIHLRISDTGHGIDEKMLPYIFDPFFTTKDVGKGTGLGLSIVYGIIKAHQGAILAESKVGSGTNFNIYLPAYVKATPKETGAVIKGEGTVLVVEDEELVRKITISILERCGFQVFSAEDGDEALRLYRQKRDLIQLVVLDVIMPKKDGMETFRELKKLNHKVRVLVSTGYLPNNMSSEFVKEGAMGFIQKPYTAMELLKSVKKILTEP